MIGVRPSYTGDDGVLDGYYVHYLDVERRCTDDEHIPVTDAQRSGRYYL
jgi:hypothetical protein